MDKFLLLAFTVMLFSCSEKDKEALNKKEYEGPLIELENVVFYYSDSALVKAKGITKHRMEFENGDQKFPKGLYLEFYDDEGAIKSTIDANVAYYNKKEDYWLGTGGVIVIDMKTGKQLKTEELYWEPSKEKIHTEKFVTISSENEVLYGNGLEANQDLSEYTIKNPTGDFQLEEGTDF